MARSRILLLLSAALLGGCDANTGTLPPPGPTPTPGPSPTPTPTPAPGQVKVEFSFANDLASWQADYSDYAQGQEAGIAFAAAHAVVPAAVTGRAGFNLSWRNESDDVFAYLTRPVTGLQPGRPYRVDFALEFATNAPAGCPGAGGAPGEAVRVKAGATATLPAKLLMGGKIVVNLDHGDQSTGGANAVVLGDIAHPDAGSCVAPVYRIKTLANPGAGPVVTTDSAGRLWLVIGTDSGYEGITSLYWLGGTATLTPA